MKLRKSVLGIVTVAFVLSACNTIDFKKTTGGVPYKIFPSATGTKVAPGTVVKYELIVKAKDSVLGTTYGNFPKYEQVGAPIPSSYEDPHMEILNKAKKGDSIYFVQSIDTFIAHNPEILKQTPFRKGDQLKTTIRITEVFKTGEEAQADFVKERAAYSARIEKQGIDKFNRDPKLQAQLKKDSKIIEDYLASNHIEAKKSKWGTYVQIITAGQGPKPETGKFSMLRYKGTDLAGNVFDENQKPGAQLLPMQIGGGRTIIGFEDGIKDLPKGTKAKLYIPSPLAYGTEGRKPKIQSNENLIFDIEVVDITDAPPAQKQMPIKADTTRNK
ncbi:MAG: hypothetical protein NVS1B13_04070 [Flavisolibacter sp.]